MRSRAASGSPARRALLLGAILALGALIVGGRPFVPVYDGVVPVEPYRWLDPPAGQRGDPQGATAKVDVTGGSSPLLAVATPETVPQAQVFAIPGGLILPSGSTRIDVSIEAVQPPAVPAPAGQVITGNVYAILVTNQAGAAVTADPAAEVSVVLRAPDANQDTASVARFDGTSWQVVATTTAGVGATFEGVVTSFGEFALLAAPPAPTAAAPVATAATAPSGLAASAAGSGGASGLAASGAIGGAPTPGSSPGTVSGESDHTLLTLGLGGLAVVIVVLVAVAALSPGRRSAPPPRGSRRR